MPTFLLSKKEREGESGYPGQLETPKSNSNPHKSSINHIPTQARKRLTQPLIPFMNHMPRWSG
jgi:hypothetical protein